MVYTYLLFIYIYLKFRKCSTSWVLRFEVLRSYNLTSEATLKPENLTKLELAKVEFISVCPFLVSVGAGLM